MLLGLGQLVQIEQRARHAIEQLDLRLVVQAVGAAADRTGFRVGRDGIHVVLSLVIVVTESRQRRDRQGRERPVDGTVHLDSREIVLRGQLVQLGLPLRVGEVDVRLRSLQALAAELVESGRDELLVGGDGIALLDDQIGNGGPETRPSRWAAPKPDRRRLRWLPVRRDRQCRLSVCASAAPLATLLPTRHASTHARPVRCLGLLVVADLIVGILSPINGAPQPRSDRPSPAAPRHKFRLKSGTFSVCRYEQVSIMARRPKPDTKSLVLLTVL